MKKKHASSYIIIVYHPWIVKLIYISSRLLQILDILNIIHVSGLSDDTVELMGLRMLKLFFGVMSSDTRDNYSYFEQNSVFYGLKS